ncbi:MAG: DUF1295 domain-containing protein [Alphaproteobacteria bacterium]|nr:DUF1295 domain-containing protein [Alphaproteobacteria bacterium]
MNATALLVAALVQWAALATIMAGAWAIHQRTGNSGFVDAVWTFSLGAVGVVSALVPLYPADVTSGRQLLIAALVAAWSLRLGSHIVRRSLARPEDPRYAVLIRQWGLNAPKQMFLLLQKQSIVTVPLALGLFVAARNPAPLFGLQDWVALLIVVGAITGEAIADRQLTACIRDRGERLRVCARGLWRWSRHPNYFFEWLFWLAFPLFAIDSSGGYPQGWLALAAPACMYWLLVYVSGIPPLEQHMVRKYGAAYRDYQSRTSAFLPWPPQRVS